MKILKSAFILILVLALSFSGCSGAPSISESYVKDVTATLGDESKNVLYDIMEVDGGVMTDIGVKVNWSESMSGLSYRVVQYDGDTKKQYEIVTSSKPEFKIPVDELYADIPMYLLITNSKGANIFTRLLTIRVNKGKAQTMFPAGFNSDYGTAIQVDMDELVPGMHFSMQPYFLPISAKMYTDGRIVIGLGINSTNTSFWQQAKNGTVKEKADVKELSEVFWRDTKKKSAVKGSNMGLVVDFAGSVQGNLYTNEPLKGQLTAYVGSGFAVKGQYLILTWDISVSVGAGGVFEFQLKYNDTARMYSDFEVDRFSIQFKTGLEIFGGVGLSSLASAGVYGAGSVSAVNTFYPKGKVDSIIVAGEAGFKVKLFSRTLFSYAIWSGSHEFVDDKKKSNDALLNVQNIDKIDSMLLAQDYANVSGSIDEPEDEGLWYTGKGSEYLLMSGGLEGYETDRDFEHLVAKDIYPANRLQVVNTGNKTLPQMNLILLGNDSSRKNGNRSRLMNLYFDETKNFMSEPAWMFDKDDGTADYDPYAWNSEKSNRTYVVWRNALSPTSDSSTFADIASNSDLYFAEFQVGSSWHEPERVTNYAGSKEGVYATGARVSEDREGNPVVTYFTNPVNDPAGLGTSVHSINVATLKGNSWEIEEAFTVKGCQIGSLQYSTFGSFPVLAVSYAVEGSGGSKTYRTEIWQKKGSSWSRVFERKNATNCRFLYTGGNDYKVMVWLENGSLYSCDENLKVSRKTPSDMVIPSSDFEIYGKFGGSNACVLFGTKSAEGSEDIFAIVSTDGGSTWNSTLLSDIDRNASVNEIGIAYTYENEPILFYSVQNYECLVKEDLEEGELRSAYTGLGQNGLMVGADDPRFKDGRTDLYVKARKSNESVEITDARFTDEEGARKGKETPLKLELHNNGLYDLSKVTVFADGKKIGEVKVNLKAGATATVETKYKVPADAPDRELNIKIGVSAKTKEQSSVETTLGTGHFNALYSHQLISQVESAHYSITNSGFAAKKVHICLYDEKTGERFYEIPMDVKGGQTMTGNTSVVSGIWVDNGHETVRAIILSDDEYKKVKDKKFSSFAELEKFLEIGSMRSVGFKALEKKYVQDFSPIIKESLSSNAPSAEVEGSDKGGTVKKILLFGGIPVLAILCVSLFMMIRKKHRKDEDGH